MTKQVKLCNPFTPKIVFRNSLNCLLYNDHDVSSENLVLDKVIIPYLIFFFILITYLLDLVLILWGEILSWSLMGVKELTFNSHE